MPRAHQGLPALHTLHLSSPTLRLPPGSPLEAARAWSHHVVQAEYESCREDRDSFSSRRSRRQTPEIEPSSRGIRLQRPDAQTTAMRIPSNRWPTRVWRFAEWNGDRVSPAFSEAGCHSPSRAEFACTIEGAR